MLIAAIALSMWGCDEQTKQEVGETTATTTVTSQNELGQGAVTFTFTVTDKDGASETFVIHTDKGTVGDALMEHGLLEGEDGAYGLYVKKVNGITADYDVDKTYWAFYVNGEYASTGVDKTAVTAGASYAFKVEK